MLFKNENVLKKNHKKKSVEIIFSVKVLRAVGLCINRVSQ